MSVTNIFRPYVEHPEQHNIYETKTRFVNLFTDKLFNLLEEDEGVVALEEVSQKTGARAVNHLLDSIRQSIRIQVKNGNVENRHQIRISVNCSKLRDNLVLDNNIIAETRKANSPLAYVKQLLSPKENVNISFQISPLTGHIFDLQNINKQGVWLSSHIIRAINQTGELISRENTERTSSQIKNVS